MGLITDALRLVVPESKVAVGATMPTWTQGVAQYPQQTTGYVTLARAGYSFNEVVYAAIEELATSAAEPRLAAYRGTGKNAERVETHPLLDLLERPNPFCDRFSLIAATIMHLAIGGNAYWEKTRSRAQAPVELWALRPDRVRVIPDRERFIRGYSYEIGDFRTEVDARDIIHFKQRSAVDDYYGLAPLAVAANRVDTDNAMRSFTAAFFKNAGVPSGMLTLQRQVNAAERELIRNRFRGELGGPQGLHSLLVFDNTDATYTPMGMPLGERGLVLPELDEISESRIAAVFGVPLQLLGTRLGLQRATYASWQEARATFWQETLLPLYQMLAAKLNSELVPEYPDLDYLEFDLATVGALQEDADAKHTRVRADLLAGIITRQEARQELDYDPDPPSDGDWVLPSTISATPVGMEALPPAAPVPALTDGAPAPVDEAAKTTLRPEAITAVDIRRAKAWAATLGPEMVAALSGGKRNGQH